MADIDEYRRDKMTVDFFRLFLFLQTVQHFLIPTYALDSHSQGKDTLLILATSFTVCSFGNVGFCHCQGE